LIVVPAYAVFSVPKTIALASDITDETDIHVLKPLQKIVSAFNAKLYVVRVIKRTMDDAAERSETPQRSIWYLTNLDPSFEFSRGENVAKAMNIFVKQHAVDLVAVVPHEHNLFDRIFTKSVTKDLVFHTHVPLLILPFKRVAETAVVKDVYTTEMISSVY
jgi:nucleotide-binding universal stress UspA family protein